MENEPVELEELEVMDEGQTDVNILTCCYFGITRVF